MMRCYPDRLANFRREIVDKLAVAASPHASPLQRAIILKQCEDFLVEEAAKLVGDQATAVRQLIARLRVVASSPPPLPAPLDPPREAVAVMCWKIADELEAILEGTTRENAHEISEADLYPRRA